MDLACAAAGMSGNNEERKADNTLTKIFKETVIGWFKQNKTTNLYEDGELPKEALDKKTNLTYTLTEAKIEHGRFGINLVNYEIDAALEDLESDDANWDDFEDIQDKIKIGFLNELKDHNPQHDLYDDTAFFKGEVYFTPKEDDCRQIEFSTWEASCLIGGNGVEDGVNFRHTLNPPNESLDEYLSDKLVWNKFVIKSLNDQEKEKV